MIAIFFVALLAFFSIGSAHAQESPLHVHRLFDDNWRFKLGEEAGDETPGFDDSSWRVVTLPHDFSIEQNFDAKAPMGGPGGFLPAGIAWYRKTFTADDAMLKKSVAIEFGGVYMNADVWCNGRHLTFHPYGYTSFIVDLTGALVSGKNVLAVKVDNSKHKNSRWYSGSGIYRHVWLNVAPPVHIPPWGVYAITTAVTDKSATLQVAVTIHNSNKDTEMALTGVEEHLIGPDGKDLSPGPAVSNFKQQNPVPVSTDDEPLAAGAPDSGETITTTLPIQNPPLWSPEHPQMCILKTVLLSKNGPMDEVETPVGLRELKWSAANGLQINGKTYRLNGGCMHHDNGVVGACSFTRSEERRVEILKASGFDEIRTSHNPPSEEFLNACDKNGLLVMDEAFDCWASGKNHMDYSVAFKDWWQRDVESYVKRDRNHPSVVFWSIGNEIPGIYDDWAVEYGQKMPELIHTLDRSRAVTNGILGWPKKSDKSPNTETNAEKQWQALDVVGSNYNIGHHISEHAQHPDRVCVITESSPGNPGGGWSDVSKNTFVIGDNVWTAVDYLGESGIGRWFYTGDPNEPIQPNKDPNDKSVHYYGHGSDQLFPWHGALCGDLDILEQRKPMSHLRNIVWDKGEKIYLAVEQPQSADRPLVHVGWGWTPTWDSWTWPGWEGKPMTVEVYSRHERVRLLLNDKVIGESPTSASNGFRTHFDVPYAPGTLKAVGLDGTTESDTAELTTVGDAKSIRLTPDRATIDADGQDLSYVKVEVVDKDGKLQPNADEEIRFTLSGPATIQGLGNADMKCLDPNVGTKCHVYHGVAMVVVRSQTTPGAVTLKAESDGLKGAEADVTTK